LDVAAKFLESLWALDGESKLLVCRI